MTPYSNIGRESSWINRELGISLWKERDLVNRENMSKGTSIHPSLGKGRQKGVNDYFCKTVFSV